MQSIGYGAIVRVSSGIQSVFHEYFVVYGAITMALRSRAPNIAVAAGRGPAEWLSIAVSHGLCRPCIRYRIRFYGPAARRNCELHQLGRGRLRVEPVLQSEVERTAARLDKDPSCVSMPGSAVRRTCAWVSCWSQTVSKSARSRSALGSMPNDLRLGEHLVATGRLDEDSLYEALSLQQALPQSRIEPASVKRAVARSLPARVSARYKLIPVKLEWAATAGGTRKCRHPSCATNCNVSLGSRSSSTSSLRRTTANWLPNFCRFKKSTGSIVYTARSRSVTKTDAFLRSITDCKARLLICMYQSSSARPCSKLVN